MIDYNDFVRRFINTPNGRQQLVSELVNNLNLFQANAHFTGPVNRIALTLKEESFSLFYEFRMRLANNIHPRLGRLNLNVITDLIINNYFNERYPVYGRILDRDLGNRKLTMDWLENTVRAMVEKDGHYMVVKACDLEFRQYDPELAGELKDIELRTINIKQRLLDDEELNRDLVRSEYRKMVENHGKKRGDLFEQRISWDPELERYLPLSEEPAGEKGVLLGDMEHGDFMEADYVPGSGEPVDEKYEEQTGDFEGNELVQDRYEEDEDEDKIETGELDSGEKGERDEPPFPSEKIDKYADIVKNQYLLNSDTGDPDAIARVIDGMYKSNEKTFGEDKAAYIEKEILKKWLSDETVSGNIKEVVQDRLAEMGIDSADIKLAADIIGDDVEQNSEMVHEMLNESMDSSKKGTDSTASTMSQEFQPEEETTVTDDSDPWLADVDVAPGDAHRPGSAGIDDESFMDEDSLPLKPGGGDDLEEPPKRVTESGPAGNGGFQIQEAEEFEDKYGKRNFDFDEGQGPGGSGIPLSAGGYDSDGTDYEHDGENQMPEGPDEHQGVENSHKGEVNSTAAPGPDDSMQEGAGPAPFQIAEEEPFEDKYGKRSFFSAGEKEEAGMSESGDEDWLHPGREGAAAEGAREGHAGAEQEGPWLYDEPGAAAEGEGMVHEEDEYSDGGTSPAELRGSVDNAITPPGGIEQEAAAGEGLQTGHPRNAPGNVQDLGRDDRDVYRVKGEILYQDSEKRDAIKKTETLPGKDVPSSPSLINLISEHGMNLNSDNFVESIRGRDIPEEKSRELTFVLKRDDFEKAFNYITRSIEFGPEEKIVLLEKWLLVQGEEKGWLDENRDGKIHKVNRMIDYYKTFLTRKKRTGSRGAAVNRKQSAETVSRGGPGNAPTEKKGKRQKKEAHVEPASTGNDSEPDVQERVTALACDIARAFSDSIETIKPLLHRFTAPLDAEHSSVVEGVVSDIEKKKNTLVSRTVEMVKNKTPAPGLLEDLHNVSSTLQFAWLESVMARLKKQSPEDVFSVFTGDKQFYSDIKRMLKIIEINNKNGLLEKTIQWEKDLVREIEENLGKEDLKKLWQKTQNRKNKDKVKLFRELMDLTGEDLPAAPIEPAPALPVPYDGVVDEMDHFIQSRSRKHNGDKYERDVDSIAGFFKDVSSGEQEAVTVVEKDKQRVVAFLRYILKEEPELRDMFNIREAIRYCRKAGIL